MGHFRFFFLKISSVLILFQITHDNPKVGMDADDIPELEKYASKRNDAILAFADKIIALSTGALTVTVAFRGFIANNAMSYKSLILFAWCGFVVATVLGISIHLCAINFYGKMIRDITRGVYNPKQNAGRYFPHLFIVMTLAFVFALSTLTAFGIYNFQE
jgi:hypothetical protein